MKSLALPALRRFADLKWSVFGGAPWQRRANSFFP
jgi:hypothetical protein